METPNLEDRAAAAEVNFFVQGDPSLDGWVETLYRASDGRYFVWTDSAMDSDHAGASFGEWLSGEEVRAWVREHGSAAGFDELFPGAGAP